MAERGCRNPCLGWLATGLVMFWLLLAPPGARAADGPAEAPLMVGSRTIAVFRAPLGAFSPQERAQAAQQRLATAFATGGKGWTSVRSAEHGVMVELDGAPMFLLLAGDAPAVGSGGGSALTVDVLANEASRQLQQAFSESRETTDPRLRTAALLRAGLALVLAAVALVVVWRCLGWVRAVLERRLRDHVGALPEAALAARIAPILLTLASRLCLLLAWLASLLVVFVCLAYSLEQFAFTRAIGEGLLRAFSDLALQSLSSAAAALPGLFVAALIFLVAWIVTQVCTEVFNHVASGQLQLGLLDAHTAPATRYIVNAALWLFALAMAYPYLPGAQTEAFKGLSVIVGVMVSLGASSLVGQIVSGLILVYTRALMVGEYVRILDSEGTVTEVGLVLTRLRTGMGAEVALPNSLVLSNITRNFSRTSLAGGFVLEVGVSIGYDTPWRQVQALLLQAAEAVPEVVQQPPPHVFQTALADSYVVYKLVVTVQSQTPAVRARVTSALYASIQDEFNRHGVQIMSPNYYDDPAEPKIVPESKWYMPPARPAEAAPPRPQP